MRVDDSWLVWLSFAWALVFDDLVGSLKKLQLGFGMMGLEWFLVL